jgi:hypothetical protein
LAVDTLIAFFRNGGAPLRMDWQMTLAQFRPQSLQQALELYFSLSAPTA